MQSTIYKLTSYVSLSAIIIFAVSSNEESFVNKLHLQAVTPGDSYSVTIKSCPVGGASVRLVEGACAVNGVKCDSVPEASYLLTNGERIFERKVLLTIYTVCSVNKKHCVHSYHDCYTIV